MSGTGRMVRGKAVQALVIALCSVVAGAAAGQLVQFRTAPTYGLGGSVDPSYPVAVLADVGSPDGPPDGILDLLSGHTERRVQVLFGKGDGTFDERSRFTFSIALDPTTMITGNFTAGDTDPDLLIGDGNAMLALYRGRGDGSFDLVGAPFTAGTNLPFGTVVPAMAAADVNGDGKLDALVVVSEEFQFGGVSVFLGDGTGALTQYGETFAAQAGSNGITVGDFTRDGKIDIAVSNGFANSVSVLRGNGEGFFVTHQTISLLATAEPVGIVSARFNADDRLDLAVVNRSLDSVAVLDGLANGTFAAPRYVVSSGEGATPVGIATGDVNRDGKADLLVSNKQSFDVSVLIGNGAGGFATPREFVADSEPLTVLAGDLNGDLADDAVTVNASSVAPTAAILLSTTNGALQAVENVVTGANPALVLAGDLDNDGVADLIVGHGSGVVLPFRSGGSNGFRLLPTGPLATAGDAVGLGSGDVDGDGIMDLVVAHRSPATVEVLLGLVRGGFGSGTSYALGGLGTALLVADLNVDGWLDLAVTEQGVGAGNGAVGIFLGRGDGSFGPRSAVAVGAGPLSLDGGDFNKDGRPDIAVANNAAGTVSILIGDGTGSFSPATPVAGVASAKYLVVADFDGNEVDDFAVARGLSSTVDVYYGNGQGGFPARPGVSLSVANPAAIAARDLTGDGLPDLLVPDEVANEVLAFRKATSDLRFVRDQEVLVARRPVSVAAADYDGDGRYDGAVADSFVAGVASVMSNAAATAALRGDANSDEAVTAADLVGLTQRLASGRMIRAEKAAPAGPGVDANGDGWITPQDANGLAARIAGEAA